VAKERREGVDGIIQQIEDYRRRLIQILEETIKEFQEATWKSPIMSYVFNGGGSYIYIYNGAAVEWRRNHARDQNIHDGYGKLMQEDHQTLLPLTEANGKPVNLENYSASRLVKMATDAIDTMKEALKSEARYFITTCNDLAKAIEKVTSFSPRKFLERAMSELVIEAIEGKGSLEFSYLTYDSGLHATNCWTGSSTPARLSLPMQ
jgi:hypothetical protein